MGATMVEIYRVINRNGWVRQGILTITEASVEFEGSLEL
jgi:hypothetical protein